MARIRESFGERLIGFHVRRQIREQFKVALQSDLAELNSKAA